MRTIAIMNIKGGVGKSTAAINFAHILSSVYGKKVLLVDLDAQSNTTKFFERYDEDAPYVGTLMLDKNADIGSTIKRTAYPGIDIIPANINLIMADKLVLTDTSNVQQFRLKRHIAKVADNYDFCIFDCPPSLSMLCMNGLAMTNDVIVPVLIDDFSFTGFAFIMEAIEDISELNENISLCGCFVNMYKQRTTLMREGVKTLEKNANMKMFRTHIRDNIAVREFTFAHQPLLEYNRRAAATQDFLGLIAEYLERTGTVAKKLEVV